MSRQFKTNENVRIRVDGQLTSAVILNRFLWGYYVHYKNIIYMNGVKQYTQIKSKWIPIWRIYKTEQADKDSKRTIR